MLFRNQVRTIALGLKPLDDFVFVGGAIVDCYVTSLAAEQARITDDIDVTLQLTHYGVYAELQEKLIQSGFSPDTSSKVICRYQYKGITVDIMPDNPHILGFSNKWYKDGIRHAIAYRIDDDLDIKIFPAPLYLASKIEAFRHRGAKDKRISTDFEDIIFVLENRNEIIVEIARADPNVRLYIVDFLSALVKEQDTQEAIRAVLGYVPVRERVEYVNQVIKQITAIK